MNKFWVLLRKELKELVTLQTIIGILASLLIFVFLGNMLGGMTEKAAENADVVGIVDEDKSELSVSLIQMLKESGFSIVELGGQTQQDKMNAAKEHDLESYLEFPKGMEQSIRQGEKVECPVVSQMTSLSALDNVGGAAASSAFEVVNQLLSTMLFSENQLNQDVEFLKSPLAIHPVTMVKERSADVDASVLRAFSMQQSMMIPIIVFLLITYATQITVSTVASEKGDKTLETLLSAPVPRLAVLGSKMCAAGLLSLLMAGVYMVGFSRYMNGMTSGMEMGDISSAIQSLGLALSGFDYVQLGVQMFLTIMIALAVSVVLGALAKDVKAAQGMITPIMFMAMIPYFVTLTNDVNHLSMPIQILLYLIPFTHTFNASANIIFGHNMIFYGGMVYQFVLLCVVMGIAVHIFSTDRIFTMTIQTGKKRRTNKKKRSADIL